MNRLMACMLLILAASCSQAPAPESKEPQQQFSADNPMTRYASDLQSDVDKARTAVNKMNKGVAAEQKSAKEIRSQSE